MKERKNNNGVFLVIVLILGIVLVFLFPKIHELTTSINYPEIEKSKEETSKENKELTSEMIDEIHSPIMRSSIYQDFTYYSLDKFTVFDMKNEDILLNAFLDMYEGNIKDNEAFDSKYIDLRVKNILNRDLEYTLSSFTVPEDSNSKYVGTWNYSNGKFYYSGKSQSFNTEVKYYDIKTQIDAKYNGDDIIITYYVGFVKVTGNDYVIYSDPGMTNKIGSGTGDDYKSTFENLNNNLKKKYQYTYKNTLCTYDEYCLYEGKWLNV